MATFTHYLQGTSDTEITATDTLQFAAGTSDKINVQEYDNAVVSFATDGGGDANLTAQIRGAIEDDVDLSAAQSDDNMWACLGFNDLCSGSNISGDTGFSVSAEDDYVLARVNLKGIRYLASTITSRTEGELTVKVFITEN